MVKVDARYIIVGLSIIIALLVANTIITQARYQQSLQELLSSQSEIREAVTVVRNQHQSLTETITAAGEDQDEIRSLLASLKRPQDTQYIVRTETVLVPAEPVTVMPELPAEYLHILEPNIVTGRFSITEDNQYQFDTYPLSFKTNLVISENQTAVLLQGSSGYDDIWHDLPTTISTVDTRERKLFEPNLQVGGGLQYPFSPGFKLGVSVWHPRPSLDALVVSGWLNQPALTIEPISYNVGAPLPLVDNLWIAPGIGIGSNLKPIYTIGIAAKLLMYLDENVIRTYVKCSELWHRQNKNKTLFNKNTLILKDTLELIASRQFKLTNEVQDISIQKYLIRSINKHTKDWLDPQVQSITNELTLTIREILKQLGWQDLVIVHEAFAYTFKQLQSHIELEFSLIAKRNNIYHFVIWSPYSGNHSQKNDIVNQLKLLAAQDISNKVKRKFVLHVFHVTNNSNLEYNIMTFEDLNSLVLKNAEYVIQNMRSAHHMPLTPCHYNCAFKTTCYPYRSKNE